MKSRPSVYKTNALPLSNRGDKSLVTLIKIYHLVEKTLNLCIWVSIAHLRCGYNDYNDYNNNLGSFYNGIFVFMLDGDDVGDHSIVCINM